MYVMSFTITCLEIWNLTIRKLDAGRDGLKSECILLFSERDKGLHEYFITVSQADDDYKDKMGEN